MKKTFKNSELFGAPMGAYYLLEIGIYTNDWILGKAIRANIAEMRKTLSMFEEQKKKLEPEKQKDFETQFLNDETEIEITPIKETDIDEACAIERTSFKISTKAIDILKNMGFIE